ncbi:MAG: hypothetical protein E7256_05550 [Lachnospiraceae bacterium]|nr:hypothetical protein [Lachnospiraceae bacterium]
MEESGWKQRSFTLNVNSTEVKMIGEESEEGKANIFLKKGSVYYAKSDEALISLDLDTRTLKDAMLSSESTDVVGSAEVTADGTILVTFKD